MSKYIMRLDDASEYMDIQKWDKVKLILDKYSIKPIYGIIPKNNDESIVQIYEKDENFWNKMKAWENDGWMPAMHGYEHKYVTDKGGINPINFRSEFAGLSYDEQKHKVENAWKIMNERGICPKIFFAPSHTFDTITLQALKDCTDIRVVSDTIANDTYFDDGITFIPQQSGMVRWLPLKMVTFCYHPNTMEDEDFRVLERFLKKYSGKFVRADVEFACVRKKSFYDKILEKLYFIRR